MLQAVYKVQRVKNPTYFVPVVKSKFVPWVKNNSGAHLHGEMNPMNLIWFMSPVSSYCSRLFTKPKMYENTKFVVVGKSKFARWANNGAVAHLHGLLIDKSNELNLVWIYRVVIAPGCLQSAKCQKTPSLCPWASQNLPDGQIMGLLHIYMVRRIQWAWFGMK